MSYRLCGPGSVVGIATSYGLDGPGIETRWGRDFPHLTRTALGPPQPPVQWVPGVSRGKERPGRDADPSPPSSATVMKGCSYTSTPLWAVRTVQSLSACTRVHFTIRPVQSLSVCTSVHFTVRPVQSLSACTRVHFTLPCWYDLMTSYLYTLYKNLNLPHFTKR
jgi:hypothetical protein